MQTTNVQPNPNEWTLVATSPGTIRIKSNATSDSRVWNLFVTTGAAPEEDAVGEVISGGGVWEASDVSGKIYIKTTREDDVFAITIGASTGGGNGEGGGPVNWDDVQNKPDFKQVAITGSFNDLDDQPNSAVFGAVFVTKAGDDTAGDGSIAKPFLTIQKALDAVAQGRQVVVGAGTYTENPTTNKQNISMVSLGLEVGGTVLINGVLTLNQVASSFRMAGIAVRELTHAGAGFAYLNTCQVKEVLRSTGAGYLEVSNSDLEGNGTAQVNITGGGTKVFNNGTKMGITTINNAGAIVNTTGIQVSKAVTLTAGTFLMGRGLYYAAGEATNALTATGGTVIFDDATLLTPSNQPARMSLAAAVNYQIKRVAVDVANSTLAGTRLPASPVIDAGVDSFLASQVTLYDNWSTGAASVAGNLALAANTTFNGKAGDYRKFDSLRFHVLNTFADTTIGLSVVDISPSAFLSLPAGVDFVLSLPEGAFIKVKPNGNSSLTISAVSGTGNPRLARVEGIYA